MKIVKEEKSLHEMEGVMEQLGMSAETKGIGAGSSAWRGTFDMGGPTGPVRTGKNLKDQDGEAWAIYLGSGAVCQARQNRAEA